MSAKLLVASYFKWLPDPLKGVLDFYFLPHVRERWGGPFNGQHFRQRIFLELLDAVPFDVIVETGTHRGSTTEFLVERSGLPTYTVEAHERYYRYSRLRFRRDARVRVMRGDSRTCLRRLAHDPSVPKTNAFFYLDAHWNTDLPLREELELIHAHWRGAIVMIDDFVVPNDPGYVSDDGRGGKLTLDNLPDLAKLDMKAFYPVLPSAQESGFKCGCVVIASGDLSERVGQLASLKT